MSKPQGQIENEHPRFNEIMWRIERVAYAFVALIIAAALAGLLGPGPLSDTTAVSPDGGIRVEYDRFLHAHSPTSLRIRLRRAARDDQPVRLWLSRSYLDGFQVREAWPEPDSVVATSDGYLYTVRLRPGEREARITFDVEPRSAGPLRGEVGPEVGPRVTLSHFVYP